MKIMRQELYDKVVLQYAESIGDEMFHVCLERLQQWEKPPPCEIELYCDFAFYSFLFKQRYPDGKDLPHSGS